MCTAKLQVKNQSVLVVCGDFSADRHTGVVLSKLKELAPELRIWGVGGPKMAACGMEQILDVQKLNCFGIVEVIRFLPLLAKLKLKLLAEIEKRKPGLVLLVDFAGFNLNLAKSIKQHHKQLPIMYFISPQIWGSRPWRIRTIASTISKMLVIFPFEAELYRKHGIHALFVGHPLLHHSTDSSKYITRQKFCEQYHLDPSKPLIGVFPGSRRQEIKDLLPVILHAISWLTTERPEVQFAISCASRQLAQVADSIITSSGQRKLLSSNIILLPPESTSSELMSTSDFLWAKSGTTTLEAALSGKPMLIMYRGNWLSYLLFLLFKQVQHVGWPNLLSGELVVPELLQLDCRAEKLVRYTLDWLDVPAAQKEITQKLLMVKSSLGQGDFAKSVATEILNMLQTQPTPLSQSS